MKQIIFLFCLLITSNLNAQSRFVGEYFDRFGSDLKINADSTFNLVWSYDLDFSWTNGKWSVKNDTLFFTMVPLYDTVKLTDKKTNTQSDLLVLSLDDKPDVIPQEVWSSLEYKGTPERQNQYPMPGRLYYQDNRLFLINKGKLVTKKLRGFGTSKKLPTWFERKLAE